MTTTKTVRHVGEADVQPFHYTACGLDNVWLLSGYERETTSYGDGVSIRHMDHLHEMIARGLITEKKTLSGKEFRFLRKEMGLSQLELAKRMRMSDQQLARWEKAESELPGPADLLVRVLYCESLGINLPMKFNELADALAEMDSAPDARVEFFETKKGWREKKAA